LPPETIAAVTPCGAGVAAPVRTAAVAAAPALRRRPAVLRG
jgi:hypothetical protein